MSRSVHLLVVALACPCAIAVGCKKDEPPPVDAADAKPAGPDYQVLAPLDKARADIKLPWVMGADDDLAASCFKPIEGLQPAEADVVLKETVDQNMAGVKKAIVSWIMEDLEPDGLSRTLAEGWTISFDSVVAIDVPADQVRFADDAACVEKGWLPEGQRLITTVVGATAIKFETDLPLGEALKNGLKGAADLKGIVMESEALFDYSQAVGADGQPLTDPDGKPLFNSPTGEYIGEADVPPPAKRQMKEWTFKLQAPLYFAVRELPADAKRLVNAKNGTCDIIIIPDTQAPQPPDCAEFRESGFMVTILDGEEKPVSLTIVTGDQSKGVVMAWKEIKKVQVDDRIILWIRPEEVEVGVKLRLGSLVLAPQPLPEGAGGDEPDYGEGGTYKSAEELAAEKKAAAEEEKAAAAAGKDKKKGKKGKAKAEEPKAEEPKAEPPKEEKPKEKKPSGNAVDDYLNQ